MGVDINETDIGAIEGNSKGTRGDLKTPPPDHSDTRSFREELIAFRDEAGLDDEAETDPSIPHKLFTPIMWYQTHFPLAIFSSDEIGLVLLDSVRAGETLKDLLAVKASPQQIAQAERALTAKHRALGIKAVPESTPKDKLRDGERPVIPSSEVNERIFTESMDAALSNLIGEIDATSIGPTLTHQIPSEGATDADRIERVTEFIARGGSWVDIVAEKCRIADQNLRSTPKDIIDAFQKGAIYERTHNLDVDAFKSMSSDDPRIPHTRIPPFRYIDDREDKALRSGIWSVVPATVDREAVNRYLSARPRFYVEP